MVELLNPIIEAGTYTIMDKSYSVEEQIDFIRNFPESGIFNVAVCNENGRILGMQDVMPVDKDTNTQKHVGEISTFVSLNTQRKGIGKALTQTTLKQAHEKGFQKILATIRADNPQAISFYKNAGFTTVDTLPNYTNSNSNSNLIDGFLMEMPT